MPTLLITGFGPFPGAPSNPTMRLARHLGRVRRTRLTGVTRVIRLLPTTWSMLSGARHAVSELKPDAILMFGLAGRRRKVTPELRAINHGSVLRVDAAGKSPGQRQLQPGAPFAVPGKLDATRMAAAFRQAGLPAAASHNAGDYLCNALFWRIIETGVPCIFVHVPRPVRATSPIGRRRKPRPTMAQLHRAAEIALDQVLLRISR